MKATFEVFNLDLLPKYRQWKWIWAVVLFMFLQDPVYLFGQDEVIISGVVRSQIDGKTLPGVSIRVTGASTGVITDKDGRYIIKVPEGGNTLQFSYTGYKELEIITNNRSVIDISLEAEQHSLDEVVVIGYGKQSRREVTSAVSKLGGSAIADLPTPTISSVLQGKIAGVRIAQNSASPGSESVIRIRGGSSINKSNVPLYIVDGFPRPFNDLDPRDIESIEVLKDAAAAAIYGARASNGVIIITTKRGKKGSSNISFDAGLGYQEFFRRIETLSAEQALQIMRPAIVQSRFKEERDFNGNTGYGTGNDENSTWTTRFLQSGEVVSPGWKTMEDPVTGKMLVFQDNDLQDILYRQSPQQNYNLTASGGTDKIQYYGTTSYLNQEGVAIGSFYNRFNVRSNVDFKINDKINIKSNTNYSYGRTNQFINEANIFSRGVFNARTIRDHLPDGTPGWGSNASLANPLWVVKTRDNDATNSQTSIGLKGDWEPVSNLHFRPSFDYLTFYSTTDYFERAHFFNSRRTAEFTRNRQQNTQYEMTLSYDFSFLNRHHFNTLLGYTDLSFKSDDAGAEAYGAGTDNIPTLNVSPLIDGASSSRAEERLISNFSRINYNYENKYLLSATLRRDGSSKFGSENIFGYFPSFSAGWVLSDESFAKPLSNVISFFKLRGSYGETGNNDVGRYTWQGAYSAALQYGGNAAISSTDMPNRILGWERTAQTDIGFDLSLFKNRRIDVLFDYYIKKSKDLLFSVQLPRETGYNTIESNVGIVEFRGYEVALSSRNIANKIFSWSSDFNIAYNTNKVISLPERQGIEKNRINGIVFADGTGFGGIAEGERTDSFFGYKVDKILDNVEEATNARYDQLAYGYNPATGTRVQGSKQPGDFEWVDRDGDGKITEYDQFILGYSTPTTTGGLKNTFNYKGLELGVFVDFAVGGSRMDADRGWLNGTGAKSQTPTTDVLRSWQKPGDASITDMPRLSYNDSNHNRNTTRHSDFLTYKSDYLCLRDVTITYNLPHKWLNQTGINNVKVRLTANNLHYFTKYPGLNPEQERGIVDHTHGTYPPYRTILFGLTVEL
ncbi:SusC/RagA family TonB-linked outer membrane protein [Sphingobacterium arenae]|uniref:TonB-dependent receptor n=1 Tax=Sphingobacterium arenae TaxID=1280598 RepID=A0ABR7XYP7_9SPHI|nr:TonB-dependent receptor [Sphingobacterium arenae]MBD1424166.1 TonB-dependent receptor [Sphingobacterium arenae]